MNLAWRSRRAVGIAIICPVLFDCFLEANVDVVFQKILTNYQNINIWSYPRWYLIYVLHTMEEHIHQPASIEIRNQYWVFTSSSAHTNTVERMWGESKSTFRRNFGINLKMMDSYLCECMRRKRLCMTLLVIGHLSNHNVFISGFVLNIIDFDLKYY